MQREYKGITFAEGYDKPFADFKKEFASTHVFKNIPSAEREAALKEAHKIATSKPKAEKPNGNTSGTISESQEVNKDESK